MTFVAAHTVPLCLQVNERKAEKLKREIAESLFQSEREAEAVEAKLRAEAEAAAKQEVMREVPGYVACSMSYVVCTAITYSVSIVMRMPRSCLIPHALPRA